MRKNQFNPNDLIGTVFSKYDVSLTVVGLHGRSGTSHNQYEYDCKCSCGKDVVLTRVYLKRNPNPFGCNRCMRRARFEAEKADESFKQAIGKRFGALVIKDVTERGRNLNESKFKCDCDCGGEGEYYYQRLMAWNKMGTPHCKSCKKTKDGIVRIEDSELVVKKKREKSLLQYSDEDPFKNRRRCTAECNVCALRQFVCCHDCTIYSDYKKCYKHCHEEPNKCGSCIGGKQ